MTIGVLSVCISSLRFTALMKALGQRDIKEDAQTVAQHYVKESHPLGLVFQERASPTIKSQWLVKK
jgi:hypothetical protein